tara:strand:- start:993 stop:2813 length:1821 start_codon:yes stop_codon:yes gene_type:complete
MDVYLVQLNKNFNLKLPSDIWLNNTLGLYLYVISFIICIFFYFRNDKVNNYIFYFSVIILLFFNYVKNVFVIDEVMMGLENPYNLINYGKFSYSPQSMIDGSVDLLFLSILTPFGFSKELLMHANYFLCFIINLCTFIFIIKIFEKCENNLKYAILIILASSQFFVQIWSPGFPSTFVILFIVMGIYFLYNENYNHLIKICVFLPLVRPDAILFSGAFYFVLLLYEKKLRTKEYLLTFCTLCIYFVIIKLTYGHFKPTPMVFKSYGLNYSFLINVLPLKITAIIHTLFNICLLSVPAILTVYVFKLKSIQNLLLLILPFSLIVLFYTTFSMGTHWGGRYLGFYKIYIFILYAVMLQKLINNKSKVIFSNILGSSYELNFKNIFQIKYLTIGIIIFQFFQYSAYYSFNDWRKANIKAMDGNAISGQILDKILPKNWTISTTELNYFGYFIDDREIVDLAGYTNKYIANSKIYNSKGIKIDPDFFLKEQTDIYWNRALGEKYPKNHLWINVNKSLVRSTFENIEKFMSFDNSSTTEYVVGDIEKILKKYDIFLINNKEWTVVTLVHRKKINEFLNIIKNIGVIKDQKKFNFSNFKEFHKIEDLKLITF